MNDVENESLLEEGRTCSSNEDSNDKNDAQLKSLCLRYREIIRNIIVIFVNMFSSVSIVFLNKYIFSHYGFPNMTLTFIHFFVTFICLVICQQLDIFKHKTLPITQMIPLTFTYCGFVVFTNLSLQYNTVGTYQVIKVLTAPFVVCISYFFYNRTYKLTVILTLVPICVGVFMNSYYSIKFNVLGLTFASVGVVVTSLYQVWVGEKQKRLEVNAMQLLFYQAPLSALFLAMIIPFFEPITGPKGIFSNWSNEALLLIFGSGLIAFFVNLSIYMIIGHTSALTYNMVGHFKFVSIILGGFILFHDELISFQLAGIIVCLIGKENYLSVADNQLSFGPVCLSGDTTENGANYSKLIRSKKNTLCVQ